MFPDQIEDGLQIPNTTGDGDVRIFVRQDEAELTKGAVAAIAIMLATPKLIAIALLPIDVGAGVIARLFGGRRSYPFAGDQLLALPISLLQIELAEVGNIV